MEIDIISLINEVDLKSNYAYEHLFSIFSNNYDIPYYTYIIKKGKTSLFRARKNDNLNNYLNFNDLSYPPSHIIKDYSRANKPLQNLFYCSLEWDIALVELKLLELKNLSNEGIFAVTIGEWILHEDLNVIIIPDFRSKAMENLITTMKSEHNNSQIKTFQYLNSIFREEATYNPNIYKITSALCNAIKYEIERKGEKIDGILYTSVIDGNGINLALSPNVVFEKKIILNSVCKQFFIKTYYRRPIINNFIEPIFAHSLDYENEIINWN